MSSLQRKYDCNDNKQAERFYVLVFVFSLCPNYNASMTAMIISKQNALMFLCLCFHYVLDTTQDKAQT